MKTIGFSMCCLILFSWGCDSAPQGSGVDNVVIFTTDLDGRPLQAQWVRWHYPVGSAQYKGKMDARCDDAACTRWIIEEQAEGLVFVEARFDKVATDPLCRYADLAAAQLHADPMVEQRVALVLRTDLLLCQ